QRFEEYESINNGKTKTQIKEEKKKKRNIAKEEKNKLLTIKKLEETISKDEDKLQLLQEKLCKEEVYSNPSESIKVNNEIKEIEANLESLYEKWELLNEN
ncbi:MAG: thiamine ABC transporter substrate-binding protein, partial [Clostridiales bacterium]|nr:thiamine ABC transporter substrate-binding protein [Clostridiales bacterium]